MKRQNRITVYVCGNVEKICAGFSVRRAYWPEVARAFVRAACDVIDKSKLAKAVVSRSFEDWRDGRHDLADRIVAGKPQGYSAGEGLVVYHGQDCPKEIRDLCDEAMRAAYDARERAALEREECE